MGLNIREKLRNAKEGEVVEFELGGGLYKFLMGSKGDLCFSIASYLMIFRNARYDDFERLLKTMEIPVVREVYMKFRVIKANHERRFLLCELLDLRIPYRTVKEKLENVILKENEKVVVDGVEFVVSEVMPRFIRNEIEYQLIFSQNQFKLIENVIKTSSYDIDYKKETSVIWRIIDENGELAKLLKSVVEKVNNISMRDITSSSEVTYFSNNNIVNIFYSYNARHSRRVDVVRINPIPIPIPNDDILLKCSTYYVIIIPRVIIRTSMVKSYTSPSIENMVFIGDVYYNGRKETLVLNYIPHEILFRCLRRKI
jgi:hypothetical protein